MATLVHHPAVAVVNRRIAAQHTLPNYTSGYEPVWKNGRRVGFVTSGGYSHHVGRSLAMALVDVEHAQTGEELHTHVVGVERGARVIDSSPYDPGGAAMRR